MTITPDRIAKLRKMLGSVQGRWRVSEEGPPNHAWIETEDGDLIAKVFLGSERLDQRNALIAAAVNDLPDLLDEVEKAWGREKYR